MSGPPLELDLLVAGGGAAGIAHASWRRAADPRLRVLVAEASERPGGWIRTHRAGGYVCEEGPQGFRPNTESDRFLALLGLGAEVVPGSPAAKRRWIVRDGRLRALPLGPLGFLTSGAMSVGAKLRALTEPWRRSRGEPGESLASFVARRLGSGAVPIAEALAHGVFAGEADRLETTSAFPGAVELEREHGSLFRGALARQRQARQNGAGPRARRPVLCSFASGMQRLVEVAQERLGDALATSTPVEGLQPANGGFLVALGGARPRTVRAGAVELALPAAAAAALVVPFDAELARLLGSIPTASVVSTYVGAPRAAFRGDLDGFGFLFPSGRRPGPVLGALYCSSTFPLHAPADHALLRVMSGGVACPAEIERTDEALVEQAIATLRSYLGFTGVPVFVRVLRARSAIPQYVPGHVELRAAIAARVRLHPGLGLRGAAYRHVSVVGQWSEAGSTP